MGVYESHAKIKKSYDDMNIIWRQTKAFWKDDKARQFEKEFMERLAIEIKKSLTALENISITLNRIRSELKEND